MKRIVLDTNALIETPQVLLEQDKEREYIILEEVLEELDGLEKKTQNKDLIHKITDAKRILRNQIVEYEASNITLSDNKKGLTGEDDYVDNIIIDFAHIGNQIGVNEEDYTIMTNDIVLTLKALKKGIEVVRPQEEEKSEPYTGYYEPILTLYEGKDDDLIANVYSSLQEGIGFHIINNQFVEIKDTKGQVKDQFQYVNGVLQQVNRNNKINVNDFGKYKAYNNRQNLYIDLLSNKDIPVVACTGKPGSGKTLLAFAHALREQKESQKKIVYVRNNISVKDVPELGYLPGDINDKLEGILAPLQDIVGGRFYIDELIENDELEVVPLNFIRGRSFKNSIIICSEFQNLNYDLVKLMLGRVGEGSEIIFEGDFMSQIDTDNGLTALQAIDKLAGNKLFGKVELNEVERSQVSALTEVI